MDKLREIVCFLIGHIWTIEREFVENGVVVHFHCYRCHIGNEVLIEYPVAFEGIDHLINTGHADKVK